MNKLIIDGESLVISDVVKVARENYFVELAEEAKTKINKSRAYVDKLVDSDAVVYGITTGFGKFSDVSISKEDTKALQRNLIVSHACNMGDPLAEEVVRGIILIRCNALAKGFSGIRLSTVQTLLDMLNQGVHPVVPEK